MSEVFENALSDEMRAYMQIKATYDPARLDGIDSSLAQIVSQTINVKNPPKGLTAAKGDGTTDDTTTIQSIIDYVGTNGGGTVYFPKGTYIVKPQTLGHSALELKYSNLCFLGDRGARPKIKFLGLNGSDPTTTYFTYNSAKWRGHAFNQTVGGLVNLSFINLEVDGSVTDITQDTFDETNKMFCFGTQDGNDNVYFENCYIHSSYGELIYSGGLNKKFKILDCTLENSKGIGCAYSGETWIERNVFTNCKMFGIEQSLIGGKVYRILNNQFFESGGAHVATQASNTNVEYKVDLEIRGNYFGKITADDTDGVQISSISGVRVIGNTFVDCSKNGVGNHGAVMLNNISGYTNLMCQDIQIDNNTFISDTKVITTPINVSLSKLGTNTYAGRNIYITNNKMAVSDTGVTAGLSIGGAASAGDPILNFVAKNNEYYQTKQNSVNGYYTTTTKVLDINVLKGIYRITSFFSLPTNGSCEIYARYNTQAGYATKDIVNQSNVSGIQQGSDIILMDRLDGGSLQLYVYCNVPNALLWFDINEE